MLLRVLVQVVLAFIAYPPVVNQKISSSNYFIYLKKLNESSHILNYERLDNLLWLIGKIKTGSFSILMDIKKYSNKFISN